MGSRMTRSILRTHTFIAAISAALTFGLVTTVFAQTLDETAFRDTIVGTKLTGMMGAHLTFQSDGSFIGGFGSDNSITGSWTVKYPRLKSEASALFCL